MFLKRHILKFINYSYSLRNPDSCRGMACSRFEYVKGFENDDKILPNVWIIVRLDGKGFHKFSKTHKFAKPNDLNALNIMNTAAMTVMKEFRDIVLAYGQSDEYSFVFRKEANIFNRRSDKLLSLVTSLFTSAYVLNWPRWKADINLQYAPIFDGRVVLYPSDQNLRDYLSWRQADVHVNNLYNTAFWGLVDAGLSNQEAETKLRGTFSAEKNELLFSQFGINYNTLPAMYRKGTVLLRKSVSFAEEERQMCRRKIIVPLHIDMIGDKFWKGHPELLDKCKPPEHNFAEGAELPSLVRIQLDNLSIHDVSDSEHSA